MKGTSAAKTSKKTSSTKHRKAPAAKAEANKPRKGAKAAKGPRAPVERDVIDHSQFALSEKFGAPSETYRTRYGANPTARRIVAEQGNAPMRQIDITNATATACGVSLEKKNRDYIRVRNAISAAFYMKPEIWERCEERGYFRLTEAAYRKEQALLNGEDPNADAGEDAAPDAKAPRKGKGAKAPKAAKGKGRKPAAEADEADDADFDDGE